jgi:hypothetical protein
MAEKIYTCEVKKLFMRNGEKVWEWVTMNVADAIRAEVSQFRCKDCHGAVRLHSKKVEHGPEPHVEHKVHNDSEYCIAGMHFKRNPGRQQRLSLTPVE